MRFFHFVSACITAAALTVARAEEPAAGPPYAIQLKSSSSFSVIGSASTITISPVSEMQRRVMNSPARKVVAAGYDVGVRIKTTNANGAAQAILAQIAEATGLHLHYSVSSSLAEIKPVVLLQGFSDTAVITIVLAPASVPDEFTVACAYTLDARPTGSNDGTPAGAAELAAERAEFLRVMEGDSVADTLPASVPDAEIRNLAFTHRFFRPSQVSFERNGTAVPLVVLMVKRQDAYTVGFYERTGPNWTLLGKPVALTGTKAPYYTNAPGTNDVGLRANHLSSPGAVWVYVRDGHVVREDRPN